LDTINSQSLTDAADSRAPSVKMRTGADCLSLKVLSWNCRGIYSKLDDFCTALQEEDHGQPAVIGLQETFTNSVDVPMMSGYSCCWRHRDPHPAVRHAWGGVALLLRQDLAATYTHHFSFGAAQDTVWLTVVTTTSVIHFCSIYLPPVSVRWDNGFNYHHWLSSFAHDLSLRRGTGHSFVMGDLNCRGLFATDIIHSGIAQDLLSLFRVHDMRNIANTSATHYTPGCTPTVIDYMLSSCHWPGWTRCTVTPVCVLNPASIGAHPSDHWMLSSTLSVGGIVAGQSVPPGRAELSRSLTHQLGRYRTDLLKQPDIVKQYVAALRSVTPSVVLAQLDNRVSYLVDQCALITLSAFTGSAQRTIGMYSAHRSIGHVHKIEPAWFNTRATLLILQRTRAWRAVLASSRSQRHSARVRYNVIRLRARDELRGIQQQHVLTFLDRLATGSVVCGSREMWTWINRRVHRHDGVVDVFLPDPEGWRVYLHSLFNHVLSPTLFNVRFSVVLHNELTAISATTHYVNCPNAANTHPLNKTITRAELTAVLRKQRPHKHAGVDGIHPTMLKADPVLTVTILSPLFDTMWDTEHMPAELFFGALSPMFKGKGGNPAVYSDYRAICWGCIVGKLFESIMASRLCNYAELHGLFSEFQSGFRKGRSAVHSVFVLFTLIHHRLQCGQSTYIAFLDIAKAYDRVDRELLWVALHRKGICGKFLRVLRAIYAAVRFCAVRNGTRSDPFRSSAGLMQGAVSSCPLFNLFFNEFVAEIGTTNEPMLFGSLLVDCLLQADDAVLIAGSAQSLQKKLDAASRFARNWKLQFNTGKNKSEFMVLGSDCTHSSHVELTLGGVPLTRASEYTYLGIKLVASTTVSYDPHLTAKCARADSTMAVLYRTGVIRARVPTTTVWSIYNGMVLPRLLFACEIVPFSELSLTMKHRVNVVFNNHCRRILALPPWAPAHLARAELGVLAVDYYFANRALRFAANISLLPETRVVKQAFLLCTRLSLAWGIYLKKLLSSYDLRLPVTTAECVGWAGRVRQRSIEHYATVVRARVQHYYSCALIGPIAVFPAHRPFSYLLSTSLSFRRTMAFLRVSGLVLEDSTAPISLSQWCRQCLNPAVAQSTSHILLDCPRFGYIRQLLADTIRSIFDASDCSRNAGGVFYKWWAEASRVDRVVLLLHPDSTGRGWLSAQARGGYNGLSPLFRYMPALRAQILFFLQSVAHGMRFPFVLR